MLFFFGKYDKMGMQCVADKKYNDSDVVCFSFKAGINFLCDISSTVDHLSSCITLITSCYECVAVSDRYNAYNRMYSYEMSP